MRIRVHRQQSDAPFITQHLMHAQLIAYFTLSLINAPLSKNNFFCPLSKNHFFCPLLLDVKSPCTVAQSVTLPICIREAPRSIPGLDTTRTHIPLTFFTTEKELHHKPFKVTQRRLYGLPACVTLYVTEDRDSTGWNVRGSYPARGNTCFSKPPSPALGNTQPPYLVLPLRCYPTSFLLGSRPTFRHRVFIPSSGSVPLGNNPTARTKYCNPQIAPSLLFNG